jgi:hypothetical protein
MEKQLRRLYGLAQLVLELDVLVQQQQLSVIVSGIANMTKDEYFIKGTLTLGFVLAWFAILSAFCGHPEVASNVGFCAAASIVVSFVGLLMFP